MIISEIQRNSALVVLLCCFVTLAHGQPIIYALNTGDTWVFRQSPFSYLDTAIVERDTVMPNGLTYTAVRGITLTSLGAYQRRMGNRILKYDAQSNNDVIVFDFDRSPGDTLASFPFSSDTVDLIYYSYTLTQVFGLSRRQWVFGYRYRHFVDADWGYAVTDSIGVTLGESFWYSYALVGARINGRTYGNITSSPLEGDVLPIAPKLYQNYPNPFNPTTSLEFRVPSLEFVSLKVYDVLGREVATLLNGVTEPGVHEVMWDAGTMASGVYFYRLQAGAFVETKKMVLMR